MRETFAHAPLTGKSPAALEVEQALDAANGAGSRRLSLLMDALLLLEESGA